MNTFLLKKHTLMIGTELYLSPLQKYLRYHTISVQGVWESIGHRNPQKITVQDTRPPSYNSTH